MNDEKAAVNFEITRIFAGWFDVRFITKEEKVEISASDAWGNDSPKYFLKMVSDFLDHERKAGYVLFDEEPGTYIICIEKDSIYKLSVLYSGFDADERKEIKLHGKLTQKEFETLIPDIEMLFSTENFSIDSFARTVLRSFEEYSSVPKMSEYEGNWMVFPKEELELLRRMLKENGE